MSSSGTWNGFTYFYDVPASPAPGNPWALITPTYTDGYWQTGVAPQLITKLLTAGVQPVGLCMPGLDNNGVSYGSQYSELNSFVPWVTSHFGLAAKPSILAQSKGGLEMLPWMRDNPNAWLRAALLYAACDPLSYPGAGSLLFGAYNVPDLATFQANCEPAHNAINGASAIDGSRVIEWAGTADTVVPLAANGALLACGSQLREIDGMNHVGYNGLEIADFLIGSQMAPMGEDVVRLAFSATVVLTNAGNQQLFPDVIVTDPNTLYNPTTATITIKNSGAYAVSASGLFRGVPLGNLFWMGAKVNKDWNQSFVDTKTGLLDGRTPPQPAGQGSIASGQTWLNVNDTVQLWATNTASGVTLDLAPFTTYLSLAKMG
jgi:hypothetical protein